ncbi:hypothetical protein [Streptomyces anulatus]|uniref:hypothetical protein n=1 Tax=Streptomyces anulatus TaxID=1892 RepID=UPI00386357BD|nr:hypothetical protein OG536_12365 [Streptomyces anulatus]
MSDSEPVILEGIPVFTGDLALLDTKVSALAEDGAKVATAAGDIHSSFGGLQAFYRAPEADQLFATTKPVADRGAALKSDLATITGALGTYSDDAYPLVEKLRQLKRDAGAFLVKANADDEWREDGDLVEENNRRRDEIAETWAAFQAVERACYNKIISLVPHGTPLTTGDGSGGKGMYGYDAEALKQAKGLPWGDPVKESTPWYHIHEHTWDFVKGFAVDGVWATVKGLGTLVGFDGWDAAKQAWTGLGNLTTGVILTIAAPHVLWLTPEDKLPGFARDARKAMTETGKALIAYDQWGENPARAGGAVTFNVLTTVFTGGAGGGVSGAGKAAVAAKALSFANKAGRFVDPTTYLFKGAGAGLTKISDVMAGLRGSGAVEFPSLPDNIYTLPEGGIRLADGTVHLPAGTAIPAGAIRLPDGTVKLPEGTVALPEGTVRNPSDQGAPYMSREGHLYNEDGSIAQLAGQSPKGVDTATPRGDTSLTEPALVGAGRVGADSGNSSLRVSNGLDEANRARSNTSDRFLASNETPGAKAGGHADGFAGREGSTNHQASDVSGGAPHTPGSFPHHGDGTDASITGRGQGAAEEYPRSGTDSALGHGEDSGHHYLAGASESRMDGARYVEEPAIEDIDAARFYDRVRANPSSLDISTISQSTGIRADILDRVRTHFFLTEHIVTDAPGSLRKAHFTPRSDIAEIWEAASRRNLSPEEVIKFERYVAHEYIESHLIDAGIPYLHDRPHLWETFTNPGKEIEYNHVWPNSASDAGAHELSLNERIGGFKHWRSFGIDVSHVEVGPQLKNIEEVVAVLKQELRSKGIELNDG